MNPQRRYRGSQYKIYKSTRRKPYTTVINPIEQDLVSALKTGAIMAAGMVGGMAIAAYAQSKSPTLAESKWAAPGLMIGSGVAVGMLLKGRNKPLATKLGMGAIGAGILVLARPYLAGKIPGFPTESFPAGTSGFAGYVAAGPLEGYTPALPQMSGFGEYDPFEYYEE